MTYPPSNDPYGNQQPPQYGQQPPQYGQQQPPQYGQQPPQYSGPDQYGQQPQYGQPQYGAPQGYGAPATNLAGWGPRVGAFVLDYLPVILCSIIGNVVGRSDSGYNALYFVFTLIGIVIWGYNRWFQAGKTGQSWGKKALGIRLVGEATGQPIGIGMAFGRDLVHILDGLPCYLGYLWPLWDQKKQTFADKLLKTLVVK